MAKRLNFASPDFPKSFERLLSCKRRSDSDVHDTVAEIIADIRGRGDDALLAFTARYDGLAVGSVAELAIQDDVLQTALDDLDEALRQSLELAAARIQAFHEKQRPKAFHIAMKSGYDLPCGIRQLTRLVFMCRAAKRLIRPRY